MIEKTSIRTVKSFVLIFVVCSFASCLYYARYSMTIEVIKIEGYFYRNFEIAELEAKEKGKKGQPPEIYKKKEIAICTLLEDDFKDFDDFGDVFTRIDEYWEKYDSINEEVFLNMRNNKRFPDKILPHIYYQEENNFIRWVKFPFNENETSKTLPIEFKKDTWYKFSHFEHDDDYSFFFYVDNERKTSVKLGRRVKSKEEN